MSLIQKLAVADALLFFAVKGSARPGARGFEASPCAVARPLSLLFSGRGRNDSATSFRIRRASKTHLPAHPLNRGSHR